MCVCVCEWIDGPKCRTEVTAIAYNYTTLWIARRHLQCDDIIHEYIVHNNTLPPLSSVKTLLFYIYLALRRIVLWLVIVNPLGWLAGCHVTRIVCGLLRYFATARSFVVWRPSKQASYIRTHTYITHLYSFTMSHMQFFYLTTHSDFIARINLN